MRVVVGGVRFLAPRGWTAEQNARVLTLRGPDGEIAMASGASVPPSVGASDVEAVELITRTQLGAADAELRNPAIVLLKPLEAYRAADERLRLWMGVATSSDRSLSFTAAVVAHERGAALLTLQGPNTPATVTALQTILASLARSDDAHSD